MKNIYEITLVLEYIENLIYNLLLLLLLLLWNQIF